MVVRVMALVLSLFAISNILSSPFCRTPFGVLKSRNPPTNGLPAVSSGTGSISVLPELRSYLRQQSLASHLQKLLNRLGTQDYCNVDADLFNRFVGIEERDLLERSYGDYLEGSVIVKGRLRVNAHFRESIGASHFVLSVIREGYEIPFCYTPTSVYLPNNKSALQNSDFVLSAIAERLKVGSLVRCPFPPVVVNPFSVSIQPSGKKRLILDLRHVNVFVNKSKI